MRTSQNVTIEPVRKSITVNASMKRAFNVFTEGFDSWWPRTHHIGKSPMKKGIIEGRVGGRCYSEQVDGTECDWGSILAWEPPHRFVIAWRVTQQWEYEPDITKCSEVEVRFTAISNGVTRVDLEHQHFERHGAGGETIRAGVDTPDGWTGLLQLFVAEAEKPGSEEPLS